MSSPRRDTTAPPVFAWDGTISHGLSPSIRVVSAEICPGDLIASSNALSRQNFQRDDGISKPPSRDRSPSSTEVSPREIGQPPTAPERRARQGNSFKSFASRKTSSSSTRKIL